MGDGKRQPGSSADRPPKQRRLRAGFVDRSARRGPLTASGKARASQNARRHGLSLAVFRDPIASLQIEHLTRQICRARPGANNDEDGTKGIDAAVDRKFARIARRIAEAQVDLLRVRRARHDLISWAFANPRFRPGKGLHAWIRQLAKAGAYVKQGLALPQDLRDAIEVKPQGAEKLALILSDSSAELARMDRYERRALSRRKYAIREFDAARVAAADDESLLRTCCCPQKSTTRRGTQAGRFIEIAGEIGVDETGKEFERPLRKIVPPKRQRAVKTDRGAS